MSLFFYSRITAMCGDYYIGGREFDTLSDLIGYYTSWSDLLKGERLMNPVAPPEVSIVFVIIVVALKGLISVSLKEGI